MTVTLVRQDLRLRAGAYYQDGALWQVMRVTVAAGGGGAKVHIKVSVQDCRTFEREVFTGDQFEERMTFVRRAADDYDPNWPEYDIVLMPTS
jgi:hypothetical protein